MKATDFIKKFEIGKAREVIEAAIDGSTHVIYEQAEGLINLKDLKRLVESVDQINAFDGGIKEAKKILSRINKHGSKYATLFERPALEQAIRDYESIYGCGGDE
ncbi:hypothetical protein OHX09_15205 [Acinetobacter baumannii]|nr:hypothetical protein [Acinetobacter baumannii]MDC5374399.1 hypothetical protein [Acinetobacter baumannii]MDC5579441.1 hypothetical protein [Acinetobacter baumannii]